MTGKVIVISLLTLIAIGTNLDPVERTDLPARVRIFKKIRNGIATVKTAALWYTIGRFSDDPESQELHQGPLDESWIDCAHPADGFLDEDFPDKFGDEFPAALIVPRGEWQKWITSNQAAGFSLTLYNDTLNYQAPEHSCVSNATETAIRVVRNRQLGLAHTVKFSPMSLYCRVNPRRWGGSTMLGNLDEASARGILPEDTPQNKAVFADHVARQNAVYFPASELFRIRTAEQFASALLRGWPIVNGRSGHSICHLDLVYRNGKYLSKYADSYGTDRGDGGYLYDTESKWATSGAWCLVSVTCPDNPQSPTGKTTRSSSHEGSQKSAAVRHRGRAAVVSHQHRHQRSGTHTIAA
jgi:hypothetical protein